MNKLSSLGLALIVCVAGVGLDAQMLRVANYPYGTTNATESLVYLKGQYDIWKSHFVKATTDKSSVKFAAVGPNYLRVARDAASNYDTVSEGQAYGMLLSYYFDDQYTFDRLYNYARKKTNPNTGLMHWMIAYNLNVAANPYGKKAIPDGTLISEFLMDITVQDSGGNYGHGIPYRLVSDLFKPVTGNTYFELPADYDANPGKYVQCAANGRAFSSATDADEDIAAALVMAFYKWGNTCTISGADAIDYRREAAVWIKNINASEYKNGFVAAGDQWGTKSGWNPSYFMPAWMRLYNSFLVNNAAQLNRAGVVTTAENAAIQANITTTLNTVYSHMQFISRKAGTGLFPDWVNTNAFKSILTSTAADILPAGLSDRYYYLDDAQGRRDAAGKRLADDRNGDGVIDDSDAYVGRRKGYYGQSFNFYYDAVRVPWRIGMDAAWYGNTGVAQDIMNRFNANYYASTPGDINDGAAIKGGSWKWADRDGFQVDADNVPVDTRDPNQKNGFNKNSPTFVAMIAAGMVSSGRPEKLNEFYQYTKGTDVNFNDKFNYFGSTLRLLSMAYLTGYSPVTAAPPSSISVLVRNNDLSSDSVVQMNFSLKVRNNSANPAAISQLATDYYFTADGQSDADVVEIDTAAVYSSTGNFKRSISVSPTVYAISKTFGDQDRVARFKYPAGSGDLEKGDYLQFSFRIHRAHYAPYNQLDDYSYVGTGYRNTDGWTGTYYIPTTYRGHYATISGRPPLDGDGLPVSLP